MRAVIHIGTHKTGTTTIQHFLANNRDRLRKQGMFFSTAGRTRDRSHGLCRAAIIRCEPNLSLLGPTYGKRKLKNNPTGRWKKHRREIERNCGKDDLVIFSDEALAFLSEKEEIAKVKELMDSLFDDVTIVCYLRRQPEYLVSFYNTPLAMASRWQILDYLNMPEEYSILAYHKLIERWSIFGKNKLKVRIFDKGGFQNNDLLSDFAHTIGLDMMGLERVQSQNVSFSSAETEFLRSLRGQIVPPSQEIDKESYSFIQHLRRKLEKEGNAESRKKDKKAYYLNRNEAQRILDRFKEGNDWVAHEYLGRDKLFSDDMSMYPEEVDVPHRLTLERSIEMSACLLKEIQHLQNQPLASRAKALWTWMKQKIAG